MSEIIQPKSGKKVFELQENGRSLLIDFYESITDSKEFSGYFNRGIKIIENAVDEYRLPPEKWRKIQYPGLDYSIFEAKLKKLRIYVVFGLFPGPIVVTGGKKTKQKKDIPRIVNQIKRYRDETLSESNT